MKMINKDCIDFNNSLNNLAIVLNDIPLFRREFHCAMSLRRMSEFILSEDNFTWNYFDFLLNAVNQFIELIEFKIDNLCEIDSINSKNEYRKLSREFLKNEKIFYTKIYKSSRYHDREFFESMVRLLAR